MNKAKTWFWIILDIFIGVLVVVLVFFCIPALANFENSLSPARTISVTAEGKTTATPDVAEISFSVVSQGQNPQSLTTDNVNKMNAVLQFVESENIATSDITTSAYDLQPNYQYNKDTQLSTINGYTLTQTVNVKIHDLTNVATVLSGLAPLGVNQIGGVNFTFDNSDTALAVARADAFNKAKAKAMEMASESGATLGDVISFSEDGVTPGPRPIFAMSAAGSAGEAIAPTADIQPGSQDVTDDVTITYSLR